MSQALFDLGGRIALVTGSSQGIGLALAHGLAGAGAQVVLNGRDEDKLGRAAQDLSAQGLEVATAAFDVSDPDAVGPAVAKVTAEIGPIDILVNNAGIQRRAPFLEFPAPTYREIMRINTDAVFFLTQAVAKGMVERRRGKIINICSVTSELGRPTIVPYTTSKGAVKMMTRGLAAELGRHNIQVNGIGPGYIETELNKALLEDKAFTSWVEGRTPAGRWGKVEELVGAAIFLAAPASDYVNGQILYVDGGMTATV
jgi:gluconate 5-dehydrogenase